MGWTVYNSSGNILSSIALTDNSVTSGKIAALAVTNAKLADDAVGADELAANAVVNASIASGAAIDATKIADGSVTSTEFQHINTLGSNAQTQITANATAITAKAPIAGATFTGTTQFATLSDGTIAVTAWVDEDNMSSNSATLIPTQQSVKAYVDAGGGDFSNGGDNGALVLGTNDSNTLTFETNNTARMVIAAAGDVTLSTGNLVIGTAGRGIDFSAQTGTGSGAGVTPLTIDSELLDHYETGSFTPNLWDNNESNNANVTYQNRQANYTRIGNRCFFNISWNWSNVVGNSGLVGTHPIRFTIPFTASNNPTGSIRAACSIGYVGGLGMPSNTAMMQARVDGNAAYGVWTYVAQSAAFNLATLKCNQVGSDALIDVSGHYEVA